MIATLNGILIQKSPGFVVVDVNGVGYRAQVSLQTFTQLPPLGEKLFLQIHTVVREDDLSLYGFLSDEEKYFFQKLITVNGIGPKLAMTVLSGIHPRELATAVRNEDLIRLTSVPGIGRKTAERIVLDLKDKFVEWETVEKRDLPPTKRKLYDDTLSALTNLGYSRMMAEKTLSQIEFGKEATLESLVKQALRALGETRV